MNEPICKFSSSKAGAINCSQFIYETTAIQNRPIKAAYHHIGLLLKGSGVLTVNGQQRSISENSIYFIKNGCVFSLCCSPETEYLYISFSGWHADDLLERAGISSQKCVFPGNGEISAFWLSCFEKAEQNNLDLFAETVLLYTVATLTNNQKQTNALVNRIEEYIHANYMRASLCISSIAAEFGYDAKYLSAVFKAGTGIPFTKYLRSIRVSHAAFLFEEGISSVKNAAALSGFSDAMYFSRVFKSETGINPAAYIQKVQKKLSS